MALRVAIAVGLLPIGIAGTALAQEGAVETAKLHNVIFRSWRLTEETPDCETAMKQVQDDTGSGIIIANEQTESGLRTVYILTANHVVKEPCARVAMKEDGVEYKLSVMEREGDGGSDWAVVRVDNVDDAPVWVRNLRIATLADLRQDQALIMVGYPASNEKHETRTLESVDTMGRLNLSGGGVGEPGFSGGGLYVEDGRLVGLVISTTDMVIALPVSPILQIIRLRPNNVPLSLDERDTQSSVELSPGTAWGHWGIAIGVTSVIDSLDSFCVSVVCGGGAEVFFSLVEVSPGTNLLGGVGMTGLVTPVDERILSPDGQELETRDLDSVLVVLRAGFELLWWRNQASLQAGLALGMQWIDPLLDAYETKTVVLGAATSLGYFFRNRVVDVKVGITYMPLVVTAPDYTFEGFEVRGMRPRRWRHFVGLNLGLYWGSWSL